jgi:hypothetical protein
MIFLPEHRIKTAVTVLAHAFIAMCASVVVGVVITALFGAMVGRASPNHGQLYRIALDIPYSPLSWGTGVLCGFLVVRRLPHKSANWVWVAGAVWLVLGIFGSLPPCPGEPKSCSFREQIKNGLYSLFDVTGEGCAVSECLEQLFFTAPMLNAIGYSLGASLASNRRTKR